MPHFMIPYLTLMPFAAAALGLMTTVVLFASLKREFHTTADRERNRVDQMLERLEEAAQSSAAVENARPVFIPVAARSGFNIDRRVHAVRLLRKGESAAHIAAALSIPRSEVELLIRVQGMVAGTPVAERALAKGAD
ncbi:MAG: hypothetical protein ABI995_06850 [Acidobacteriota bacterium]